MSDEVLIEELRTAMRAEVSALQVPPEILTRVITEPPRARPNLSWLMPAMAVAVAAVVAVVAVTSLSHHRPTSTGVPSAIPVAARGLASHLAVLRRRQRPRDVLPRWAVRETESLTRSRGVLGGLSRLVGRVNLGRYGRARVYLVVQRPPRFPLHSNHPQPPLLNPRLGDQATIAFVGPFREEAAINGPTVAAGGETVAATGHGLTADPGQFSELWGAVGAIVPDGVARVKWVFGTETPSSRFITVWARPRDNVAVGRIPARLPVYMRSAVWYGPRGRVMSGFGVPQPGAQDRALNRARQASLRHPVAVTLLHHFGVLSNSSTSSYPGLDQSDLKALLEPNPLGLNAGKVKFVVDPTAPAKVFVVPGSQGIALRWVSPGVGQAEAGTSAALSGSLVIESTAASGRRTVVGLAPDGNRTVKVLLRGGRIRVVPVVSNVYATDVPAGARTVILRNAAGRTVRIRLG